MKSKSKIYIFLSLFTFLFSPFTCLHAIEVGGTISEDTTWSSENNPYIVTENIYVEEGITLTIQAGTDIKISGAVCDDIRDFGDNFWINNGETVAKFFWVDGRIIAEGTANDSINFSVLQEEENYFWGSFYIRNMAELCIFKHCNFQYSAGTGIMLSVVASHVLTFNNGKGIVKNCTFKNNAAGIITYNGTYFFEFIDNQFLNEYTNNFVKDFRHSIIATGSPHPGYKPPLIANNFFECGSDIVGPGTSLCANNKFYN